MVIRAAPRIRGASCARPRPLQVHDELPHDGVHVGMRRAPASLLAENMHDELRAQVSEQLGLDVAVRDVARLQVVCCRAELPDSVEGH
eukprot:6399176-Pyramimonas_sp.AAC.1